MQRRVFKALKRNVQFDNWKLYAQQKAYNFYKRSTKRKVLHGFKICKELEEKRKDNESLATYFLELRHPYFLKKRFFLQWKLLKFYIIHKIQTKIIINNTIKKWRLLFLFSLWHKHTSTTLSTKYQKAIEFHDGLLKYKALGGFSIYIRKKKIRTLKLMQIQRKKQIFTLLKGFILLRNHMHNKLRKRKYKKISTKLYLYKLKFKAFSGLTIWYNYS